jgi:hypothetical protein
VAAAQEVAQDAPHEELRRQVERLREYGAIVVAGERIAASPALAAFYERRGFAPAWTDPQAAGELLRALRGSEAHGLDPGTYHLEALAQQAHAGPPLAPAGGVAV